jgi:hypothetical protein
MANELSSSISKSASDANAESLADQESSDSESDGQGDSSEHDEDNEFEVDPNIALDSALLRDLLSTNSAMSQVAPLHDNIPKKPIQSKDMVIDWNF